MTIQHNVEQIEERIGAACERSGRAREDVNVIAVTKYASLETAEELLQHGIQHVGESRWPDAREKWTRLGSQGEWHFIGHLQTNKVKDIVGRFSYIHSLDRPSLAQALQKRGQSKDIDISCFIQVNVSGEQTKHGCSPEELFDFAQQVSECDRLRIMGLMTMAPYEASEDEIRRCFAKLNELKVALNEKQIFSYDVPHLSMGMSNDFEIAIEEGATWVRLGSVLIE